VKETKGFRETELFSKRFYFRNQFSFIYKLPLKMSLHLVTVATHSERYLPVLEKQAEDKGLKIEKLGMGKKYIGHYMKDMEMIAYLKTVPPEDIVIFVDGFDSLILSDKNEIMDKFLSKKCKMLLSVENIGGLSFIHDAVFEKIDGNYLNSGLYMGYAGFMLEFLETMYSDEDFDKKSNQKTWMRQLNRLGKVNKMGGIKFDVESDLFLNHSFTTSNYPIIKDKRVYLYDSKPCFIQGTGCEDMSGIIKETGYSKYDIHKSDYYIKKAQYNATAMFKTYPIISLYILMISILLLILSFLGYRRYRDSKDKYFYL
jgi:hypothetical protein